MTKWKTIYIYSWIVHSSSWHWSFQIYGRVPKMPTQLPYPNPLKATSSKWKSSWNKVSLQISLERNLINSSYIFILSVNFENLTVRLHVLIILNAYKISKKIKNQLLCHQINIIISSFCNLKLYIKNKLIDQIVNNIRFERNLICMCSRRRWACWA